MSNLANPNVTSWSTLTLESSHGIWIWKGYWMSPGVRSAPVSSSVGPRLLAVGLRRTCKGEHKSYKTEKNGVTVGGMDEIGNDNHARPSSNPSSYSCQLPIRHHNLSAHGSSRKTGDATRRH